MPGILYVVATPIGNLEDLSPRALEVLRSVDVIACEDTRHTAKLLSHFDIRTSTTSYHEHNEEEKSESLVERLQEGGLVALVSDAGTPLLSDPGYRLVHRCREEEITVRTIPGPFAAAAAVSISGLPTDQILFAGFLPSKAKAARNRLEELEAFPATLVLYLPPHRLEGTLRRMGEVLGNRPACLIREMTKIHEESISGSLEELAAAVAEEPARGEYTIVVGGAGDPAEGIDSTVIDLAAYVAGLTESRGISKKAAIKQAAAELGLPKREVYAAVVESGL